MSSNGWKTYRLGELADITSSKRIFLSDYVSEGIPFYRSKEIIQRILGEKSNEVLYISKEKFFEIKEKFGAPQDGDLLISAVGERAGLPYVVRNEGDFYFKDGNLIWFRAIAPSVNIDYLCSWLKSSEGQASLDSLMIGSAQKALTIVGLKNLQVTLPPIQEQKRIASILSSLDDKIELNRQTNATLEAMAQALFKEWFVEANYPGASGEMEESEMGMVPRGWSVVSLGEIVDFVKGVSYRSNELAPSDCALVTLKSINRNGGFNSDGFKEYDGKYKPQQELQVGDIVIAQTDITQNAEVVGCPAVVENPLNYKTLVPSIDVVKVTPKEGAISKELLFEILRHQTFKEFCLSHTNGSTVLHLRSSELPRYQLTLPPIDLKNKFAQVIKGMREKILENNHQIQTLTQMRDGLLPQLMCGTLKH